MQCSCEAGELTWVLLVVRVTWSGHGLHRQHAGDACWQTSAFSPCTC